MAKLGLKIGRFGMAQDFTPLMAYLERMPAIKLTRHSNSAGTFEDGNWWIKFTIDTRHPLAWRHVQELGFVLNNLSRDERLPTIFMPISPPPYLNGGVEFLSWVIESKHHDFTPALCAQWLEGRLPQTVEAYEQWELDGDLEP